MQGWSFSGKLTERDFFFKKNEFPWSGLVLRFVGEDSVLLQACKLWVFPPLPPWPHLSNPAAGHMWPCHEEWAGLGEK